MALRNVTRNWNRTGMIIISMAVASAIMTLTLALSTGYAEGVSRVWRQMVGADIIVYPNRFVFAGSGDPGTAWEWRRLSPDLPTDAVGFHPDLAQGYLAPADAPPPVFDLQNLPPALAAMTGAGGGLQVEAAQLLPAYIVRETAQGKVRLPITLRGRNVQTDIDKRSIPETAMMGGSYFRPAQDGFWVAITNGAAFTAEGIRPGDKLVVEVPTIRGYDAEGRPVTDYANPQTFYFMVYGQFGLEWGQVRLEDPAGLLERSAVAPTQTVFLDQPEVWVPAATFAKVFEAVAGGPQRYTGQLAITLDSMAEAKTVAQTLAAQLPDCAVLTVPQEVSLSGLNYRARLTSLDPFTVTITHFHYTRPTLALDVKDQLAALAFVVAGLLVVANMYILVTQRRREIGVLKALGAASRDILALFLTETLGYSLAGSLLGFLAVRLITLASIFASSASLVEGALLTLQTAGAVVGLTVGISLVFGFLPAWEAARTPSASLLGDA